MNMRDRVNKWRKEQGLPPIHEGNFEAEPVPPLPPPPKRRSILDVESEREAWQVWLQTMFLSDGDREAADIAYDAVRKAHRKEK